MAGLTRIKTLLQQFATDRSGNFAIVFAICLVGVVMAIGAGYDLSRASTANAKAQMMADQIGLNAAVYISNHGVPPESSLDGFIDGVTYKASDIDASFDNYAIGGAENVTFTVTYDDVKKEAVVHVNGDTDPAFMGIFGHKAISFNTRTVVKYKEVDVKDPASVFLVLDNSGSMGWDDRRLIQDSSGRWNAQDGAQSRIHGLKSSVLSFMEALDEIAGPQNVEGERVLRTGMLAYNSDTIESRSVDPDWGVITEAKINNLAADGGTDSSPPLSEVDDWMAGEPAIHLAESGHDPLKFVIFMTDGVNTSGGTEWVALEGTEYWRRWRCTWRGCSWQYRYSISMPSWGSGWEEGEFQSTADIQSLASCASLEAQGVNVYTIGYALEPGWYEANSTDRYGRPEYTHIDQETTDHAYGFLQGCASKSSNFIVAEDADELEAAFSAIGNKIAIEIIRLAY